MSELFGKNIKYLRTNRGYNQSQMLDFTGISGPTWSDYERGKTEPDFTGLRRISEFFNVPADWLISQDLNVLVAKGNLIIKDGGPEIINFSNLKGNPTGNLLAQFQPKKSYPEFNETVSMVQEPMVPKLITVDSSGHENVLYVPVKARAGYLTGYADREYVEKLPAYRLPGYNNGTYRIFEVDGISMFNTLQDKDRCVARWAQVSEIRDDRVYVLVTRNDGLLIKRCINRYQEGKLICKSDNNHNGEYPPIVLEISEVLEVWYVVERWTRQLPPPGELYKRITNLEADMELLKRRLPS